MASAPPSPKTKPEVSGRAFLGLIRFVKDTHGEDTLREVFKLARDGPVDVFARRIAIQDWLPYDVYTRFLRALEKQLAAGDRTFARRLGAIAGKRDLGTVLKVFVAIASAERLIRACSKIWPSYYRNAGSMEALEWQPERTVLRVTSFPEMHPLHCQLMEGWMIATMATIGCKVSDDARESVCSSRGGPHHEFVCSWTRARS
jgi:hypothetical protein